MVDMKTLITFETKYGYTKECAEKIASKLPDATVLDVNSQAISIDDYDRIIIGVPIYKSTLEQDSQNFITKNQVKLLKKPLGIFCSGMNKEEFNYAVQNSLPAEIFYHSTIVHSGGKVDFTKLSFFDKRTIKRRLGITSSIESTNTKELNDFIEHMKTQE